MNLKLVRAPVIYILELSAYGYYITPHKGNVERDRERGREEGRERERKKKREEVR